MSKEYSWADLRESAAESFGGRYPDAELEQEILDVFEERPAFVVDAIADVSNAYKSGRVHSPWAFLRTKVTAPQRESVVSDESDRVLRESVADTWIRNAGLHFDRESELLDVLYGDQGLLRHWSQDESLRARMLALWTEQRALGEQVEAEAEQRALHHKATRLRLEELERQKRAALDAAQEVASTS